MKKILSQWMMLVMVLWGVLSTAQSKSITGIVSANGNPIGGVEVLQEGTSNTTISSSAGQYAIVTNGEKPLLIFSHPDYQHQEVSVSNQSVIDVDLKERVNEIKEVVINAGYYSVKDREKTGSIAKVSSEDIQNQPVTNVLSAVQGRMAGVSITQSSGISGGGYDIQIRGRNSLRREGNEPLYIIDGVPIVAETPARFGASVLPYSSLNPLNSINPNDIESFEILKDADATAIYGSRGANGVILITTKKGRKNRMEISFNAAQSFSTVARKMKMMNTQQYLDMRRQAYENDGITTYPATAFDVNGTWDQSRETDWQKELLGNTATNNLIQLTASGGGENTSYRISYAHNENSTVFPSDFGYKTNNIASNIMYSSPDKKWNLTVSNLFSTQKNNVIKDDYTSRALLLSPNAPALYNSDGSLNWENNTFTNPVAAFESSYSYDAKTFNTGITASYQIFPFLQLKMDGGINYTTFEEWSITPHTIYNPSYGLTSANSSSFKNNQQTFSYILEPQLLADWSLNQHRFNLLVGSTLQQTATSQNAIQGYGFETNALIRNLAAAKTKIISDLVETDYNYAAVFGRLNYALKGRYIINFTARRDGSSRFGDGNRFANFGAVGAAWIFSEEELLKNLKWLSFGKLRASYGTSGNDKIGDYQFLDTYTVSSTIYDGVTGLLPSRLYNPNFSWEKTTKKEIALELAFLKNRINLSSAYFNNTSSNQLVGIPLPATTGFSTINANLPATVRNTGWEFEAMARPFSSKSQLKWETAINLTIPRNKLVAFPNLEGSTYANQYVVGEPTNIVKVYQYNGIDSEKGLYQFTDVNGDGKITSPEDNKTVETLGQRWFGGWSNSITYKNLSLSFLLQFVKQKNWNYNKLILTPGSFHNQPVEVLDVWSLNNPTGTYMPYSAGTNVPINTLYNYYRNSTAAIGDASFVRLKNVQLSYKLPLRNNITKEVTIYAQGQNLLTWTNYFGLDPEFLIIGYLPPLKTFALGTTITF
ncbi:SusC/RagA family TonB-linked outer membrane protein [Chryseobacterium sp. MFBS3-17]|uniref:SusC/RagA family TonB-linked outer membrane protein n=1 Tax=Chryseobacterium sp. MFBS3-17 TaxID=2886689 RepID=UPI001D0E0300|nr:SusC/RagA family TonB-linked outer membrane protein [Chryseobacterium sp. MFBS3-17]MCC2590307.1 SusC/RagA family TonB-linked outer membrane protein [Chryseobacterium sp. MFBS3-17]